MTHSVWQYVDREWRRLITSDKGNAWDHARATVARRPGAWVVVLPVDLLPSTVADLAPYTCAPA